MRWMACGRTCSWRYEVASLTSALFSAEVGCSAMRENASDESGFPKARTSSVSKIKSNLISTVTTTHQVVRDDTNERLVDACRLCMRGRVVQYRAHIFCHPSLDAPRCPPAYGETFVDEGPRRSNVYINETIESMYMCHNVQ